MTFPFAEDQTVCDMKDDGTLYVNTHKIKGQRRFRRVPYRFEAASKMGQNARENNKLRSPTHRGNFATGSLPRYIPHMAEPFRCYVCEQVENRCKCDRYCALCQGEHQVRLCQDGQYYCLECREACDFQAQY